MKKILLLFVLIISLLLTACENGNAEQPKASEYTSVSSETAEEITNEGSYEDYHVKIMDAETIDDYDGSPAIKVTFEYSNVGTEANYFYSAFATRAFQNGVELDEVGLNDESKECQNLTVEIKDGASLTCAMIFLTNTEDDVEITVGTPTAEEKIIAEKIVVF